MAAWYEQYVGKPWKGIPNPPDSYTCGELARAVLRDQCGIDAPEILADAFSLRSCINAMRNPGYYGLRPLAPTEQPQQFDVVFLLRTTMQDHVGIAVDSLDGLMIMHCQQGPGVTMGSIAELHGLGFRHMLWHRHVALDRGTPCPR
ncbi:conserved hypothetical protein [uncultured Desulfovibrio sp.]|uniref:NlpC/P60 domain-containing protein n=1 Tax=uncultured Desulfovibrio sp. TaxID=167968 RepID=A0A212IWS6_9BACT|nr:hypothetical protein [uncultured Desulfovibrio sp.]SBV91619.1 conserved hypothetical protein [uncultured Desulfovibrio sp.]